jgi:hypothetical protein
MPETAKADPQKFVESALRDGSGKNALPRARGEEQAKPESAAIPDEGRSLVPRPAAPAREQRDSAAAAKNPAQDAAIPVAEPVLRPVSGQIYEAIPANASAATPASISGSGSSASSEAADEEKPVIASLSLSEPWKQDEVPRTWIERILLGDNKDPRTFPRLSPPQLFAYYFTGGPPVAKRVRDISTSGLYLETGERWYLGTIVQLTLTDRLRPKGSQSISLFAKVVRWGSDGVGLKFLLDGLVHRRVERYDVYEPTNGIGVDQVGEFVRHFEAAT